MTMKNRILVGIAIAASLIAGCSGNETTSEKGQGSVADSTQIAIAEISEKIGANPNDAALLIERAKLFQIAGNYKAGFEDASKAVGIDSSKAPYWLEYGKTAFAVENYLRSEQGYMNCVRLDNKNTDCLIKLAEFYLFRSNPKMALDFANQALKIDVNLARPYFIKGWTYMMAGDTGLASTSYQTAVELDPNFYDAYIQLGILASDAKKDVSLDYSNSAIAIRPTTIEAYYFKGTFLQNRGRNEEAIQTYREIIAVDSMYAQAWYNIGYIKLTRENKPDSAIDFFSKAISVDKNYAEAYYNRGYCKELTGEKAKAANDYKLSLGLRNDFTLAKEGLARVQ